MTVPKNRLPSYDAVSEPRLIFHPDRTEDTDIHPLRGLLTFGPYSRGMPLSAPDPIRVAVICPEDSFTAVSLRWTPSIGQKIGSP